MSDQNGSNASLEAEATAKRVRKPGAMPKITSQTELRGVEVTRENIEKAIPKNSHSCMIAEAIKREHPEFDGVQVDVQTIRWNEPRKNRRVVCLTPRACQQALVRFDLGVPPEPFKFNVRSFQVVARAVNIPKLDAEGKPVKRVRQSRYVRKDGSVNEAVREEAVTERVVVPSRRQVVTHMAASGERGRTQVAGGQMPPQDKRSFKRTFGQRAFTWGEEEAPEVIAARIARAGYYVPSHELTVKPKAEPDKS